MASNQADTWRPVPGQARLLGGEPAGAGHLPSVRAVAHLLLRASRRRGRADVHPRARPARPRPRSVRAARRARAARPARPHAHRRRHRRGVRRSDHRLPHRPHAVAVGRRIPYVVLATPWWALLFFLLFVPPFGDGSLANLLWLVVVIEGYWLASNLSGAPLEALMPHIARSHEDRVSVAAMQLVFGILGAFIGLAVSSVLIDLVGFAAMAGDPRGRGLPRPLRLAGRVLGLRRGRTTSPRRRASCGRCGRRCRTRTSSRSCRASSSSAWRRSW